MDNVTLGIIGGSGLYSMPGLQETQQLDLTTPFGKPSAPVAVGVLEGVRTAFLARHGIGHTISPSEINFRANIYALKSLGVERIVSISAVGSLREDYAPGEIVIPDQLLDFTRGRIGSFFDGGLVAHVGVADPFCPDLSQRVYRAVKAAGTQGAAGERRANIVTHRGGAMITIQGPRFSTKAESNVYRSWGMSLIGMTTAPEAFLAREAEICYAVMAHVTDYDVWHVSEQPVTVDMIIETLNKNTVLAQEALSSLARDLNPITTSSVSLERPCECPHALAAALITSRSMIPDATRQRLGLLVDKYLA
jgi:5'-methylthioadenosine phosphorylase